ncbi:MAG: hypothetical protein IKG53_04135 [Solobacterium sp.]|nr:hypothetical protein [Solobacterium sp.]
MKKNTMIWSVDDEDTDNSPHCIPMVYEGISSLIPLLNTADIREDIMDLKNGTAYHFYCRDTALPVFRVLISRYENGEMVSLGNEDTAAVTFVRSHYLQTKEDDYEHGGLYSLEKAVNEFLMHEEEEVWARMCLQLYNCLLNGARVYLNSYEEDMKRGGMRLVFTSCEAKDHVPTASQKTLPLELLIRDIVEDDAKSRGLAIMSDNGWGMRALLPKDAVRDVYALYLAEVSGS